MILFMARFIGILWCIGLIKIFCKIKSIHGIVLLLFAAQEMIDILQRSGYEIRRLSEGHLAEMPLKQYV